MVRNLKKLYEVVTEQLRPFVQPELDWLTERYNIIKELDGETPVGVSLHQSHGREGLERINAISDVLMIHPYYICDKETIFDEKMRQDYIENVNMMCDFGKEAGKPMVVTEICWGALTDEDSVEAIKFTLDTLSQHNFGFVAHALHFIGEHKRTIS